MTTQDALDLRHTLRALKQGGAVDSDTQLAYATDKTLRALDKELEVFEDTRLELIAEHSERDEKGRRLVRSDGEKVAVEENEDHQVVAAYEPGSEEEVDLQALNRRTENVLEDQEALQSELDELRSREEEGLDLHQVSRDRFMEHADLEDMHNQVDLSVLDPWFKNGEAE
jgi:hypothetical protein